MFTENIKIIDDVLSLKSYAPSAKVNATLTSLVDSVVNGDIQTHLLNETRIEAVRNASALAEAELELFWAHLIVQSDDASKALATFPYLGNYVELTRREIGLVRDSGLELTSDSKVLIVGSGPLPLTAYELFRQTGAQVHQVDVSEKAADLGKRVCDALGMQTSYYVGSGEEVRLSERYDLILIAALAGDNIEAKQAIIDNVLPSLRPQGRFVVRSARGNRELLYPEVKSNDIKNVRLLSEYHPEDYIINSVLVYGK